MGNIGLLEMGKSVKNLEGPISTAVFHPLNLPFVIWLTQSAEVKVKPKELKFSWHSKGSLRFMEAFMDENLGLYKFTVSLVQTDVPFTLTSVKTVVQSILTQKFYKH